MSRYLLGCSKFSLQDLDIIHIGVSCTKEMYTYANQMWKCYEPLARSLSYMTLSHLH